MNADRGRDATLDAWYAPGFSFVFEFPDEEAGEYAVRLDEFGLRTTGGSLDEAFDAMLLRLATMLVAYAYDGTPLPERKTPSADAGDD